MPRIEFGDFTLDEEAGELLSAEGAVPLMPTEYRLLRYFAGHPKRLLAKQELLDAIWPDAHVTDASLARAVATLRKALGDAAREPRYIETLPRRGYKFIAAIEAAVHSSRFRLFCDGRMYPLRIGENILGRDRDSVVPIESTGVSRRHAIVTVEPNAATVTDLHSMNGTFVNGQEVSGTLTLSDGDDIRIGPVLLTITTRERIAAKTTDVIR